MLFKRITLSIFTLCLFTLGVNAQSAKLKRAQKQMDNLNYSKAIELYNEVLKKTEASEAKINIAECYRKIGDSGNAEFWYGQVVRLPEAEPIAKLYYGQMLQRNGKCELARDWFNQYIELVPDDLRGQYLARACDYEQELMAKNAGIYEIKHLDFNSDLDDFGSSYYSNGIVFASDRDRGGAVKRDHNWTGNPFLELYFVESKALSKPEDGTCPDVVHGRPEKFSGKLNTKYHDAAVSFSGKGKEIFFTRNNLNDGKTGKDDEGTVRLKIFFAKSLGENQWGEVQGLPFNSDEYSVAHPALSYDGNTLYFTSDMPGGFGGMDLYLSKKENGRWGPPTNLGPQINTEGHEIFPYISLNNRLYYSSDGLIGLGGLDIFYSSEKAPGEWEAPENMGYPINTISDDFGVVFDEGGTCGYFSSDRAGGVGGDDIYSFKKTAAPVEIFVYDETNGMPLEGATVLDSCTGRTLTTNNMGIALFDVKLNSCCAFQASFESYKDNSKQGCTTNMTIGETVRVDIPLRPDAQFSLEGVVFDEGTGYPMAGATVTLFNDCGQAEPEPIITDETGRFFYELDKECCYKVKGEKTQYIAGAVENLCTRGLTEPEKFTVQLFLSPTIFSEANPEITENTEVPDAPKFKLKKDPESGLFIDTETNQPYSGEHDGITYKGGVPSDDIASNPTPEKGPSSTEDGAPVAYLLNIYYDFDQSYIRDDAEPELETLLTIMTENPQYIIEIGSHTDARGPSRYNTLLSKRRASAVVKWLVRRGVERDRLIPIGYAESQPVNGCKNNIPCSEREHQLNRRTEFKIVGCKGCVEPEEQILSKPNENVRVDECKDCPF